MWAKEGGKCTSQLCINVRIIEGAREGLGSLPGHLLRPLLPLSHLPTHILSMTHDS